MTEQEFRTEVRKLAPPTLPADCLAAAMGFSLETQNLTKSTIRACIQLAYRLACMGADRTGDTPQPARMTPGALVMSEQLIASITPWVERVRQHLFESPQQPFASYAEAATWVEQQKERADTYSKEIEQEKRVLEQEILEKIAAYQALQEGTCDKRQ